MYSGKITLDLKVDRDEEALKDFINGNRTRATQARTVDMDWPQGGQIRSLLVQYATTGIRFRDFPVVLRAIDNGLSSYERHLGKKPDWMRMIELLEITTSALATDIAGVTVRNARGDCWNPAMGVGLRQWLIREKSGEVKYQQPAAGQKKKVQKAIWQYLSPELPESVLARING